MFFDRPQSDFIDGSQYYFNVLVTSIAVSADQAKEIFNSGITSICDIQKITDPRPKITYIYIDETLDKDISIIIECFPHQVVEINQQSIKIYEMIDFDTDDPWEINPCESI